MVEIRLQNHRRGMHVDIGLDLPASSAAGPALRRSLDRGESLIPEDDFFAGSLPQGGGQVLELVLAAPAYGASRNAEHEHLRIDRGGQCAQTLHNSLEISVVGDHGVRRGQETRHTHSDSDAASTIINAYDRHVRGLYRR